MAASVIATEASKWHRRSTLRTQEGVTRVVESKPFVTQDDNSCVRYANTFARQCVSVLGQ